MNIAIPAAARAWFPLRKLMRSVWSHGFSTSPSRTSHPAALPDCTGTTPTRRPLRVVRVAEAGLPRSRVGRMVISGRMVDVCAELDRLAACETAYP